MRPARGAARSDRMEEILAPERRSVRWPRLAALALWVALLVAFWLGARAAEGGLVDGLLGALERLLDDPRAPLALLGLYLLRPLLLVPITALNLAAGFAFGAAVGAPLALAGTLLSATVGYGVGRALGSGALGAALGERSGFVRSLRERAFESVVAGGLMYLHADLVNLPAGALRVRFPIFLLGIAVGNALAMTSAVLAGAALEGDLTGAGVPLEPWYLAAAAALFLVSAALAYRLRRRDRAVD